MSKLFTDEISYNPDALDKAGRLVVANADTLGSFNQVGDDNPEFIDTQTLGSGASNYLINDSSSNLSVGASSGDFVIRQTYQRMPYQTGKTIRGFFTFSGFAPVGGVIKRVGLFDDNSFSAPFDDKDGVFLEAENDGSTVSINVYKNGTLRLKVPQGNWMDPLDGSGPSGITVDWDANQLVIFEYLWLGVDGVTMKMSFNGVVYKIHKFPFTNILSLVSPFQRSPNKPIRYEVRSVGGAGDFTQICSTAESLGSINKTGFDYGIAAFNNLAISNNQIRPLLAYRVRSGFYDQVAIPVSYKALTTTGGNAVALLLKNPPLLVNGVSTAWESVTFGQTRGSIEYTNFSTAPGSGDELDTGYEDTIISSSPLSNNLDTALGDIDNSTYPGVAIDGTRDVFVLAILSLGNESFRGFINIKELR